MKGGLSMKRPVVVALTVALVALSGCEQAPSGPGEDGLVFDPALDLTEPPSGGSCPNVYWESQELLENGATVTWTSGFGGFEYSQGSDYSGAVAWSVDFGSATLVSAGVRSRGHTWTPRGQDSVDGTLVSATPPFTINMADMHRGDEDTDGDGVPDWQGLIGNGHFWLVVQVDGMNKPIKLGVNFHLEDPDDGFSSRCPTG
jgi:hypothetical protein